jgi:hypothetical protein
VELVYTHLLVQQLVQFAHLTIIAATLQHPQIKLSYVQTDISALKG